jgi:hypothetical protein
MAGEVARVAVLSSIDMASFLGGILILFMVLGQDAGTTYRRAPWLLLE